MLKSLMINCDKATKICDKSQYNEASLFEKIQLKFHLLLCKVCFLYSKQNSFLSTLYKLKANSFKKQSICISSKDKEQLKKQIEQLKSQLS